MSSRDWSTIGAHAALPRWARWAIPPLLIPLAGIAWLIIRWNDIPLRYGHPLITRTPLHVFGFLIFAEGLASLLVGMVLAIWCGSNRRPGSQTPMEKVPLAMAYLLSLVFTAVGMAPVADIPAWLVPACVPLAALATIVYVVRGQGEADDVPDTTPDDCWSSAGVYRNPNDPSLFVRARVGYGYTFNMANPWAHRIIIGFFAGIALLVGFLIWALR
jgi:protein-S-isoprenylcysteine O-methyltransferase Ste14